MHVSQAPAAASLFRAPDVLGGQRRGEDVALQGAYSDRTSPWLVAAQLVGTPHYRYALASCIIGVVQPGRRVS